MTRSCLHCALMHALEAESAALTAGGFSVTVPRVAPVWLPGSGMLLYRGLRRLLQAVRVEPEPGPVKIAIVDLVGKSHVEVMLTVRRRRAPLVLHCAFPRYAPGTLDRGFAETDPYC